MQTAAFALEWSSKNISLKAEFMPEATCSVVLAMCMLQEKRQERIVAIEAMAGAGLRKNAVDANAMFALVMNQEKNEK